MSKVDGNETRTRIVYLSERIKALKQEVGQLRAEEGELADKLRTATDKNTPEMKALKSRRLYVRLRPQEATTDIKAAFEEKRSLPNVVRSVAK